MPNPLTEVWFGRPSEISNFAKRHQLFVRKLSRLNRVCNLIFGGETKLSSDVDRLVFISGLLCLEDFDEILLLCTHGAGTGGKKILRGMYERAVTANYLHDNPNEVDAYTDYHWVSMHRFTQAVKRVYGSEHGIPQDKLRTVEENFSRTKDKFKTVVCKKCGTSRAGYTWSSLDFVSMAAKTELSQLLVTGYYVPMFETHSTVQAMNSRFKKTPDGNFALDTDQQIEIATTAVQCAHALILDILDLECTHFRLSRTQRLVDRCHKDWEEIWTKKKPPVI